MTDTPPRSRARRAASAGAAVGATTAVASGAGSVAAAAWFARRVLTPDRHRPDDVVVRAARASTVVLGITPETDFPGGALAGMEGLSNRVQLVDSPVGKGHVVSFAIRPYWRWQTQGTYFLGFNAIMNWNDLDAGR